MKLNNKYIRPGDSADTIIDKTNFNFDQILSSGFGPTGFNGPIGPTGVIGKIGPDGATGATGLRGSNWFQQNTAPATAGVNLYDYWINTSSVNQDQVYYYAGASGWIDSGYSLRVDGEFSGVQSLIGPEGATGYSAIVLNATGPNTARTTLVFSDKVVTASDANPNLAKVLISTNSLENTGSILGFSKSTTNSPGYPQFSWSSTGSDYSLSLATNSELAITAGREFSIQSGDTFSVESSVIDLKSGSSFSINSTGPISITSNPTIQLSSLEMTFQGNSNSISVPVTLNPSYGSTGSYKIDIEGSLFDNGLLLTSGGATSGPDVMKVNKIDGTNLIRSKQNSQTIIGVTGSTGSHLVDSFRTVECQFVVTTTAGGSFTIGVVDLSSPDFFDSNKIYLTFPSSINQTYPDPRFYLMLPSPTIDSKICNPGEVSTYQIFNGGTGYRMEGITFMQKVSVGNNAVLTQKTITFPNPADNNILTLTYAGDQSSFFYMAGTTGAYVQMSN